MRKVTETDPVLSKVLQFTMNGWPDESPLSEITPYFKKRHKIAVENGCLLWGISRDNSIAVLRMSTSQVAHEPSRNCTNKVTLTTSRLVARP